MFLAACNVLLLPAMNQRCCLCLGISELSQKMLHLGTESVENASVTKTGDTMNANQLSAA